MPISPIKFAHFVAVALLLGFATAGTLTAAERGDVGRLVEVRPARNQPVRVPKEWQGLVDVAVQNLPTVVIEVDDDTTRLRTANGTLPTPEVFPYLSYQNAGDSGLYIPLRASDEGAMVANHQGVGTCLFGLVDVVTQYDLLVYVAPESGPATFRVSLWDSDPLGIAPTWCANDGIPVPIPGTTVTFSNLPAADTECVSIGASLDDPECPGLYRLKASFPNPQMLSNFHCYEHYGVYMVLELLEGCHAGWRIAGEPGSPGTHKPEKNRSDRTIIHTSQGIGTMTCCDSGAACESGSECSHDSFCSRGIADTTELWTRTLNSWPSTVASLFVGTTNAFFIRPVSADAKPQDAPKPDGWRIAGDDIFLEPGDRPVWFDVYMKDWDPNEEGLGLTDYFVFIDQEGFSSGEGESLTLFTPGCTTDAQCASIIGPESRCRVEESACDFVAQERSRTDFVTHGAASIGGVSNAKALWGASSLLDYWEIFRCQGTTDVGKVCRPYACADPDLCVEECPLECETDCIVQCVADHTDRYLGTFALQVPAAASGTYSIGIDHRSTAWVGGNDCFYALNLDGTASVTITDRGACLLISDAETRNCFDDVTREQCALLADVPGFTLGAVCESQTVATEMCCFGQDRCEEVVEGSCVTSGGQVVQQCGSANDQCSVPSVSLWGLSALTVALLAIAKIRFRHLVS